MRRMQEEDAGGGCRRRLQGEDAGGGCRRRMQEEDAGGGCRGRMQEEEEEEERRHGIKAEPSPRGEEKNRSPQAPNILYYLKSAPGRP